MCVCMCVGVRVYVCGCGRMYVYTYRFVEICNFNKDVSFLINSITIDNSTDVSDLETCRVDLEKFL